MVSGDLMDRLAATDRLPWRLWPCTQGVPELEYDKLGNGSTSPAAKTSKIISAEEKTRVN